MNANQRRQRVKEISQAYDKAHAAAHARYNKAFDDALRRHGLSAPAPGQLIDVHDYPAAFHADEDLAAARAQFLDEIKAARTTQQSGAASLPRPNVQFIRTVSRQ